MPVRSLTRLSALAAALLGCNGMAHAGETPGVGAHLPGWYASVRFDIARDLPVKPEAAMLSIGITRDGSGPRLDWRTEIDGLSAHEELGPRWSYQPARSGPSLELAALGAGRKERPGLAHIAVDWNF